MLSPIFNLFVDFFRTTRKTHLANSKRPEIVKKKNSYSITKISTQTINMRNTKTTNNEHEQEKTTWREPHSRF